MIEFIAGFLGIAGLSALLAPPQALPSEADYKKALDKIKDAPNDPDANLVAGKYMAFVIGDYATGMSYLAKTNDKVLRTLAEHEAAPLYTDTPIKQATMGDEWVNAAKSHQALFRIFYDRASFWYAKSWADMKNEPLWGQRLRDQGRKLAVARPPGPLRKGVPTGWKTDTRPKEWPQPGFDGSVSHEGSYSLKFPAASADPKANEPYTSLETDLIPISGKVLELSAYVMTDGTDSGKDMLEIRFRDATGKEFQRYSAGLIPVDTPFWSMIKTTHEIPTGAVRVQFATVISSTKGTAWVDDILIKVDGKEIVKQGFEGK